jgi:hypothetical protein
MLSWWCWLLWYLTNSNTRDNTNMSFLWIFHLESSHHNLNVYLLGLQHDQHLVMSNLSFSHTNALDTSDKEKSFTGKKILILSSSLRCVSAICMCQGINGKSWRDCQMQMLGTLTESNDARTKLLWLDFLEKLNPCAGIASPWALSAQINTRIPILFCMLVVVCLISLELHVCGLGS